MNALVAYFSYGGNTRRTGQRLGMKLDADFYEIAPKVPYTAADVNWQDDTSRNVKEYKDVSSRPEMDHQMPDLSRYDVIYLGFPIWWYTNPRIINTFLDSGDFKGKKIILFATSSGTGTHGAWEDLKKTYPEYDIREGRRVGSEEDLDALIREGQN